MADLGSIGAESVTAMRMVVATPSVFNGLLRDCITAQRAPDIGPRSVFRCMRVDGDYQICGGMELVEGSPSPPSLRMDALGKWTFRWLVQAEANSISALVKQADVTPRPSMVVKANPLIGVPLDLVAVAPAGSGWVTIGPITVTPSVKGGLRVELRNNYDCQFGQTPCYFEITL